MIQSGAALNPIKLITSNEIFVFAEQSLSDNNKTERTVGAYLGLPKFRDKQGKFRKAN